MKWELREQVLDLNLPRVMGILNVTPDSFSDGGLYQEPSAALARARQMEKEGADLIDIGGESTRPGARPVSPEEEWRRLGFVLKKIRGTIKIPISVDTQNPEVAKRALENGVEIINDVSGGQDREMLQTVAKAGCGYVLMHRRGNSQDMMERAQYRDVLSEVQEELQAMVHRALAAGIKPGKICIDPGFGFAKNSEQNFQLFEGLESFCRKGYPLLVGISRKKMLRDRVGEEPVRLRGASVTSALCAVQKGANIVRVHDVMETVEILRTSGLLTKGR